MCCVFLRLDNRWVSWRSGSKSSNRPSSEIGFKGLEGVWPRFKAGPARSRRARRAALGAGETRERGVKNFRNFLGVIDGFLFSLPSAGGNLGGEESRLLVKMADLLVVDEPLSAMISNLTSQQPRYLFPLDLDSNGPPFLFCTGS